MEVGQVGFRDDKQVVRSQVTKRCSETVNRLNKTRQERFPNLQAEREAYDQQASAQRGLRDAACSRLLRCFCADTPLAQVRAERKAEERLRRKGELEATREREQQKEERSYDRIMGVRAPSSAMHHHQILS
jgi:hypothetical protein